MSKTNPKKRKGNFATTRGVGDYLGKSAEYVRLKCNCGELRCYRTSGGDRVIFWDDVDRFLAERAKA